MDCQKLAKLFSLAAVLFLAAVTPAAAAFEMSWQGTLTPGQTWHRPTRDMQQVATGAPTPYSVQSIYVDRSGVFEVESDVPGTVVPFHGFVFLYAGSFDPTRPLLNLVAGSDGGPDGVSPAAIAGILTADAVYYVVTTSDDPLAGGFSDKVSGPGAIHPSDCAAPGTQTVADANAVALLGGRFCVTVSWKDDAGTTHTASPIPFRSDTSAAFWFFNPGNWELQVKVLDACGSNRRFWVLASGSTHLDYTINVTDTSSQSTTSSRSYHSKAGSTRAIIDTQAFDGCPATTAHHK
jgi:hypothetical protein